MNLRFCQSWLAVFVVAFLVNAASVCRAADTMTVTADGVADPKADIYAKDKGLMMDHLRADAKRNAVEKVVGCYVTSETLVRNFEVIKDQVLSQSKGFIKQILEEQPLRTDGEGLVHLTIKAEVVVSDLKTALTELSQTQRVQLLVEKGNPIICVAFGLLSAKQPELGRRRSEIAENIFKERLAEFGYRVWSLEEGKANRKGDFLVEGEAKIGEDKLKSHYNELEINQTVLTSWTIKCKDMRTNEEIYFNNKVPENARWANEDQAIKEIGQMLGQEFSKDFFDSQLSKPTRICQMEIVGLPDYDAGVMVKNEFVGLRQIVNVELRDFDVEAGSVFEVELADADKNLAGIVQSGVVAGLNKKVGYPALKVVSAKGNRIKLTYAAGKPQKGE